MDVVGVPGHCDPPDLSDKPEPPYRRDMLMLDPIRSAEPAVDCMDELDDLHPHMYRGISDELDNDDDRLYGEDSLVDGLHDRTDGLVRQDGIVRIDRLIHLGLTAAEMKFSNESVPDAFILEVWAHVPEQSVRGKWRHDAGDSWASAVLLCVCICVTGAVFALRRHPPATSTASGESSALNVCEMAMSDMVHAVADAAHAWEGGMSVHAHLLTDAMYALSCTLYQGGGSGPVEVDAVLDNLRHALSTTLSARTKIYRDDTISAQRTLDVFMGHRPRRHSM